MILAGGGLITADDLPGGQRTGKSVAAQAGELPEEGVNLEALERGLVEKALARARGNRSQAARFLGLTRSQLYTRLRRYGLHEEGE